jgi:hypothetical protein
MKSSWFFYVPALVWTFVLFTWVYRRDLDLALVCGVIAYAQWDAVLKGYATR